MVEAKQEMKKVWGLAPTVLPTLHSLCPGCGEPIAGRLIAEALHELGVRERTVLVMGIGCYGAISNNINVDRIKALHGRAPSVATGLKRVKPEAMVFTIQGDGDMVSEGLQEVVHAAARGEKITCFMVNNFVFGETGGHMTSTTPVGQRTKSTMQGRDPGVYGYPIRLPELLVGLEGAVYLARGSVHTPVAINKTRRMVRRALEAQVAGAGFALVEIMTMCPTGWFIEAKDAPKFMDEHMVPTFPIKEFKVSEKLLAKV